MTSNETGGQDEREREAGGGRDEAVAGRHGGSGRSARSASGAMGRDMTICKRVWQAAGG
jgi:hypothetical protein